MQIIGQTKKSGKILPKKIVVSFSLLLLELKIQGPYRSNWPHYSKIKGTVENYHCHIEKGKPTDVVCWRILNKKQRIIEVYYAGTHEKTPY